MVVRFQWVALAAILAAPALAGSSKLDAAAALQQEGRSQEALTAFHAAASESGVSGDRHTQAEALSAAAGIAVSLGDYAGALADARQAIDLRRALHLESGLGSDFNTLGLAHQYLGNYSAALEQYQQALNADRTVGDAAGEITRLNNIGNIFYFQGHYSHALETYQQALARVNATSAESWNPWARQLTIANTATLYQRLGLEANALKLYEQLLREPQKLPANEYAQLLLNKGVLYRRLGDPVKALELYAAAQALFRSERHADGEISALRNIGFARAMDLQDLPGALQAFATARDLATKTSNSRGMVQASLYSGEVLRRLKRMQEAEQSLNTALDGARKTGLPDEQWRALYSLGQIAEDEQHTDLALTNYQAAIVIIETVRAGLQLPSLKKDFLADKRDVYDSLIALELKNPNPPLAETLRWMERSRARTLTDRLAAQAPRQELGLAEIQSRLEADQVFVEFWMGSATGAAIWATSHAAGVVQYASAERIKTGANLLLAGLQTPGDQWKQSSRDLGVQILTGIPRRTHVIVVPDGSLNIPFEVLRVPGSDALLVETSDVSYLPSAQQLGSGGPARRRWLLPWSRQMVAFGDPPVSSGDALVGNESWQRLPRSSEEVREISHILRGRSEIHLGTDARASYLLGGKVEDVSLLHFSTHALLDEENPDRSRILMAADASAGKYLFQQDVYNLDLKKVDLVTLSACDTARGKMVRGEGIQAFSQAFLAAGASATVTSLWKVDDAPTASFMQQLYFFLGNTSSKAQALQAAKLNFLRSNSILSSPRYWAPFVLYGNGWQSATRVIPWSVVVLIGAALLAAASLALFQAARIKARKKAA